MLHRLVENAHEASYIKMMIDIEVEDRKEKWIDGRANELIKNFSNENDWQILKLIKVKLENNCVDGDIYNQFIADICYSQAKIEYKKKCEDWR